MQEEEREALLEKIKMRMLSVEREMRLLMARGSSHSEATRHDLERLEKRYRRMRDYVDYYEYPKGHDSWYRVAKTRFLKMYGMECACCGERNIRFLTIDHVQNNALLSRTWGPNMITSQDVMRDAVTRYQPDKYQVLCYNCNMGKAHNYGICPHKEVRREWPKKRDAKKRKT
jgi:hypothetical protein